MKIKINRNILWTETFVNELASLGVKYVSISPGSRNTPLTLAFANNKKIKSYINIDERSSGFFALGLAKASNTSVAVVCTSGTATVELYPAIVEAYQQRVPLIICTADRPPELLNRGANQTINQNNLYKNHIRWFNDVGLPEPSIEKLKQLKDTAVKAVVKSTFETRGPVHLNFPFKKPFEPNTFTDDVENKVINFAGKLAPVKINILTGKMKNISGEKWFENIYKHIAKKEKGIIIIGPDHYDPKFLKNCELLSEKLNYPILADGTSQIRFGSHKKGNIITNFDAFLRSEKFAKENKPDIILQFGRTITSKALDTFLESISSLRFMINEYGDWFDPSDKATAAYACKPYLFCETMIKKISASSIKRSNDKWLTVYKNAEAAATKIKEAIIYKSQFPNECRAINEILDNIPEDCQIMLSNSMPVRDFDYFASYSKKKIVVYNNRGASGIDGITSTALGIAEATKKPTVLITGDLAFYYDLNGLLAAKNYNIPLVVILLNNNGGGIFEILPISKYGEVFKKYFVVPHQLDFSHFVKAYGGNYIKIKNWPALKKSLVKSFSRQQFSVLELKTSATDSLKLRRQYWKAVSLRLL